MASTARFTELADALGPAPSGDASSVRWWRAPGRVNLIGDHTDYNDGFALPFAIDRECLVAARANADGRVRVRSLELPGVVDVAADGTDDPAGLELAWGRFVAGVVRALADLGRPAVGLDLVVSSTVPAGSGLASSAALEVTLALALVDAGGITLDRLQIARACRHAEHLATSVPSGLMDQVASLHGVEGHALLLDCRTLAIEPVALPRGLTVLVVHSGIARTLAGSEYADRQAACGEAAERLGLPSLRDAHPADVRDDRRARHVVSENQRVLTFAAAMRAGDIAALGPLLLASHASLRDDYDVSTPELDLLVDLLVEHGALGARLTGAGFGGCVIALVPDRVAREVARKSVARYSSTTSLEPSAFVVRASGGAGPLRDPRR